MKKEEPAHRFLAEDAACERCLRPSDDDFPSLKLQFFRGEFICADCLADEESCGCYIEMYSLLG